MAASGYHRRIEVRVPSRDLAEGVETALGRLGYELLPARIRAEAPDARFVAAGRLSRLPAAAIEPVVLFGGMRSKDAEDPRVVGVTGRPAGLHELYELLQGALEQTPRIVPRVSASLPARSFREGVDAPGAILSLSERGCLLRSTVVLPGDGALKLQFALPDRGLIDTWAEPCNKAGRELGLVFDGLPDASRFAIADYVTASLTSA
ncbi:MAG: hypothetical protein JRG90_22735 [Deltaproteobacteria bacterium]|nr:hypothetical protein [Deltaproteobacteria bacterium]MBW2666413.1 hypothetical protein [Deltaproteobacteria bacterium]